MEVLNIDYKFSIEYDTDSNDRPVRWTRYGEEWSASTKWEENNAVTAMFYRMLEDRAEIDQLRAELEQERELAEELAQASKRGLNYLENTENELGILLDSAESLRDALTAHATRRNK